MEGIKQICAKELARVFKDRKMLVSVFIFPVAIMIVVMSLVNGLSSRAQEDVEAHQSIVYIQNMPEGFEEFLSTADKECKIYTRDNVSGLLDMETEGALDDAQAAKEVKNAIRDGEVDLMIEFPEGFLDDVESYQQGNEIPQVKTYYNPSEDYSSAAMRQFFRCPGRIPPGAFVPACGKYGRADGVYSKLRQSRHDRPG